MGRNRDEYNKKELQRVVAAAHKMTSLSSYAIKAGPILLSGKG